MWHKAQQPFSMGNELGKRHLFFSLVSFLYQPVFVLYDDDSDTTHMMLLQSTGS